MASLHMRTWFNALPRRHHAEAASSGRSVRAGAQHGKKRVAVPICRADHPKMVDKADPEHRTRSPKTGFRRSLRATRRTVGALLYGALEGKVERSRRCTECFFRFRLNCHRVLNSGQDGRKGCRRVEIGEVERNRPSPSSPSSYNRERLKRRAASRSHLAEERASRISGEGGTIMEPLSPRLSYDAARSIHRNRGSVTVNWIARRAYRRVGRAAWHRNEWARTAQPDVAQCVAKAVVEFDQYPVVEP